MMKFGGGGGKKGKKGFSLPPGLGM
jgi:hypothetical protein